MSGIILPDVEAAQAIFQRAEAARRLTSTPAEIVYPLCEEAFKSLLVHVKNEGSDEVSGERMEGLVDMVRQHEAALQRREKLLVERLEASRRREERVEDAVIELMGVLGLD